MLDPGSSVNPPDMLNQTGSCSEVRHNSGMKIIRNLIIVVALLAVAFATSACPEQGPAEKAGEKIDEAVDDTKDAVEDATK